MLLIVSLLRTTFASSAPAPAPGSRRSSCPSSRRARRSCRARSSVIPEVVTQVAAQVIGNDAAITIGGMNGHFELNVYIPLLARNLLQSIGLLASASRLLAEKCVDGIEANRERCESYAELTLSAATALNPFIGYDKASEIVKTAAASGRSLREVALRRAWRRACSTRRSTTTRWPSRTVSRTLRSRHAGLTRISRPARTVVVGVAVRLRFQG